MTHNKLLARQIKRFILSFEKNQNECWEWKNGLSGSGYGTFRSISPWNGKKMDLAHRFSFELFDSEIPKGMFVCHRCDNTKCVNPDHLFVGNQQDNMSDKVSKKRQVMGEKMHNCKLNWNLVRVFREEYAKGVSCTSLSKKYGFHESTIADVVKGRSWRE